jgi:hypothetical protein
LLILGQIQVNNKDGVDKYMFYEISQNFLEAHQQVLDILGYPEDIVARNIIDKLITADYIPGTFMLSERKQNPAFLSPEDNIDYERWLSNAIREEINSSIGFLEKTSLLTCTKYFNEATKLELEERTFNIIEYQLANRQHLSDKIPNQEYQDIIRRATAFVLNGNPSYEYDTYQELNSLGESVAFEILKIIDDKHFSLLDCMKASIAAGLIGVNMKTAASAASRILCTNVIPLKAEISVNGNVLNVWQLLQSKVRSKLKISFWEEYEREVVLHKKPLYMASFPDDYIETIFHLYFYQRMLLENPYLKIHIIPKRVRCGNDSCWEDIMHFLQNPILSSLKQFYEEGRFLVCKTGPLVGTFDGNKMSSEVASILLGCDLVDVRGARNYETMQGLLKKIYFGFAVCREISESITGLDAESGALVFIKQDPGVVSFRGFCKRNQRTKISKFGRRYGLAEMTAQEYAKRVKKEVRNLTNTCVKNDAHTHIS